MENPGYIDGRQGIFLTPPDKMVETWLPWWKAGFQINVHTNGNGGNQATINALEALLKAYPRTDHRFAFQHFGISTPEMARQVKVLGGVVSARSLLRVCSLGIRSAVLRLRPGLYGGTAQDVLNPKTESVPTGVSTSCDIVLLSVGVTVKTPCLVVVPPNVASRLATNLSNCSGWTYAWIVSYCAPTPKLESGYCNLLVRFGLAARRRLPQCLYPVQQPLAICQPRKYPT